MPSRSKAPRLSSIAVIMAICFSSIGGVAAQAPAADAGTVRELIDLDAATALSDARRKAGVASPVVQAPPTPQTMPVLEESRPTQRGTPVLAIEAIYGVGSDLTVLLTDDHQRYELGSRSPAGPWRLIRVAGRCASVARGRQKPQVVCMPTQTVVPAAQQATSAVTPAYTFDDRNMPPLPVVR